MLDLGAPEIALVLLAFVLLFGYKKLPDASRSLGRSLRIFRGEMRGMQADDGPAATASPVQDSAGLPAVDPAGSPALDAAAADLEAEAVAAEARAADLRARVARSRSTPAAGTAR